MFDSQSIRPSSLIVGTRPLGFIVRYSGSRLPPKGPPRSTRSYSMPSSAQHHNTFCTLDEVVRPQIFSIAASPITLAYMELSFLLDATAVWAKSYIVASSGGSFDSSLP